MGTLHSLENHALARMRARLGAVEEANQDLIAFARGHHDTVGAIHRAALSAMRCAELAELQRVVTRDWPRIVGIDRCALALPGPQDASLSTRKGNIPLDRAILARAVRGLAPVTIHDVPRGHAFFGCDAQAIRAEALIRVDFPSDATSGVLLLGQSQSPGLERCGGNELLRFLGHSLAAIIERWRLEAIS